VHMQRLVLVAVKEDVQPEVFVKFASSLFQVGRTEGSWGLSLAALR